MGYIKLHRKMFDWEWYGQPDMVALWVHILLSANHESKEWRGMEIGRGEFITSLSSLSNDTGLSVQTIRTCLKKLQDSKQINIQSTRQATKIIVCNYGSYQDNDSNSQQTTNTQSNTQLTRQSTTTKEDKNIRKQEEKEKDANASKEKRKRFVPPSVEDVKAYAESIGYSILNADDFVDFYTANGWVQGKSGKPIVDWKACVRTWKRRDEEKGVLFPEVQAERDWHTEGATYYKNDFVAQKKMAEFWALDGTMKKRMDNGEAVIWENGKFRMKF